MSTMYTTIIKSEVPAAEDNLKIVVLLWSVPSIA